MGKDNQSNICCVHLIARCLVLFCVFSIKMYYIDHISSMLNFHLFQLTTNNIIWKCSSYFEKDRNCWYMLLLMKLVNTTLYFLTELLYKLWKYDRIKVVGDSYHLEQQRCDVVFVDKLVEWTRISKENNRPVTIYHNIVLSTSRYRLEQHFSYHGNLIDWLINWCLTPTLSVQYCSYMVACQWYWLLKGIPVTTWSQPRRSFEYNV